MLEKPRLELRGVTKQYPGVLANSDVDLKVLPGEIHALLGENGAGKSTLVKFIYGVHKADSGKLLWEGAEIDISSPNFARKIGIGMVFQHFSLFEALTVEENVAIGVTRSLSKPGLSDRIRDVSQQYGLPLDPSRYVHTLSVGERQRVEVVRCLLQSPRLLIMDEPTSVLTPQEVRELFKTLRRLASEGISILYISHKLQEIKDLCHTATIMRMGSVVAECIPDEETPRSMAEMMMGANLVMPQRDIQKVRGSAQFSVANVSKVSSHQYGVDLKNINFQIHSNEVLGIAGIAGNGQTELLEILSGETLLSSGGSITIDNLEVGQLGPNERRIAGMAFVPEERLGHGAVPEFSLWENTFLSAAYPMSLLKKGFIKKNQAIEFAKKVVDKFNVKTTGVDNNAGSLSGGNLQKFIFGREILQEPAVIIALQPTWGVDAGSAAGIRQALIDLSEKGAAVLVISQDLEELYEISDTIAVIYDGELSDLSPSSEISVEEIGLLMSGITKEGVSGVNNAS